MYSSILLFTITHIVRLNFEMLDERDRSENVRRYLGAYLSVASTVHTERERLYTATSVQMRSWSLGQGSTE